MADKMIRIDEFSFPLSSGSPFVFGGVHSGKDLAGLNVDTTVYSDAESHQVDELLKKRTVTVEDPFAGRQYEATFGRKSYSYADSRPGKQYQFEVKELDKAIEFKVLEIEGQPFPVMRNTETLDDGKMGLQILLRLSSDEFVKFHSLLKPGPVKIQRMGIDESSILRRFGGAQYWSSHQGGSQKFYKQIVRFYPTDTPPSRLDIATGHQQNALSQMVLALSARYEALVKALVGNGQISQETAEELIGEEWQGLIDNDRQVMMRSKLTRINDAELEFD